MIYIKRVFKESNKKVDAVYAFDLNYMSIKKNLEDSMKDLMSWCKLWVDEKKFGRFDERFDELI